MRSSRTSILPELSEYKKKAGVFRKKADTSAMIGKTGETAPICGDGRARCCGAAATRRGKAVSYIGASGIESLLCCITLNLLSQKIF